ncbi:MAG: acetate--CoA ligase family protein [Myxococcota bacterium]
MKSASPASTESETLTRPRPRPHPRPRPSPSPLGPILEPRSVAVIGASRDSRKRGFQAVRGLLDSGFRGRIYPVNQNGGGELLGLPVARAVRELDETPDLAFVCTPASSVPGILLECAEKGIPGAVVSAVGFKESGGAGAALERELREVAARTEIRVVGPNTSGVLNTAIGLNLVGVKDVRPGTLGLLVQSGNVGLALMNEATSRGQGLSVYVGVGNEVDIAFHEYLDYLGTEPQTRAVLMYVEGFRDGRQFIEVAGRVTEKTPIVLLKGGRTEGGVASARSHTGAIAGSYPVLRAALRQGGVIEVQRSDELLAVGVMLAGQPAVPAGLGVAVLSDGGGHATLAADTLSELDVQLAPLSERTKARLRKLLGSAASVENPVDVAGAADRDPRILAQALELIATDPATGGILVVGLFGGYAIRFAESLGEAEAEAASMMTAVMAEANVPLVVHTLYSQASSEALGRLAERGVPLVGSLELASRCMRAAYTRGLFLRKRTLPSRLPQVSARRREAPSIVAARHEKRSTLTEPDARELVAEHGVPLAPATLCKTQEDVVRAVEQAGAPVALKVVSPSIPHKSEAGGVELHVSGAKDAAAAFKRVLESASQYAVGQGRVPDVRGVLVAPMLPPPIAELIVGVKRDPQFGPVLTVGAGGVAVELLGDAALRGLPIGRDEALEMLDEIRLAGVLNGYRGRPPAHKDSLADIILGVAACALSNPGLEELEANPVFAYADRAVAVDVRAFLGDFEPQETSGGNAEGTRAL